MTNPSRLLIDGSKFGLDWLQIYWYGALIVLSILIAYILCSHEAKRRHFHKDCVIDLVIIGVPLGAIFARLYYVVFALGSFVKPGMTFKEVLLGVINVRDGGLAIYGAILGAVIALLIYSRVKKIRFLTLLDLVIPTIALGQAIGRWGNFFNQEAYGRVISEGFPPYFPLAVKIDECYQSCCADLPSRMGNIHYATFFYESCWCFIIFIVLWFILRRRVKHRGDITLAYLIMYGVERAIVEPLRTDSLMWGSVRVSQALSIALAAISVVLIVIRALAEKKKGRIVMPYEDAYFGPAPLERTEEVNADGTPERAEAAEETAEEAEEAAEETAEEAEEAAEEAAEAADEVKE